MCQFNSGINHSNYYASAAGCTVPNFIGGRNWPRILVRIAGIIRGTFLVGKIIGLDRLNGRVVGKVLFQLITLRCWYLYYLPMQLLDITRLKGPVFVVF